MKDQTIISALQGDKVDLSPQELQAWCEQHPFSLHLCLLWLVSLKQNQDARLAEEIHRAAIRFPDRRKLKEMLETLEVRPSEGERTAGESRVRKVSHPELERQYITEAVQVSIGMDADEQADQPSTESSLPPEKSTAQVAPESFLDFIQSNVVSEPRSSETPDPSEVEEDSKTLIERFLQDESPRPVTYDFNAAEAAQRSLEDNDGPVSDTLARIYASQGNYRKAIEVYERLRLIYPEKSGYFAARIEKVLELKNKRKR